MSGGEKIPGVRSVIESALSGLPRDLQREALTHISYANENSKGKGSNERLEYLGDAVLYLGVGYLLYQKWPGRREGELTRVRAHLVSGETLASLAKEAGLGEHLLLGRGEETTGGRERPSILAGTLEAVTGAVFLNTGWEGALEFVRQLLVPRDLSPVPLDAKSSAQELVQKTSGATLEYKVLKVEGPDHRPKYTVACLVNGQEISSGTGSSKKEAEENAARSFLENSNKAAQNEDDSPCNEVRG